MKTLKSTSKIVMDSKKVNIKAITSGSKALKYEFGEESKHDLGTPLTVHFPSELEKGSTLKMKIEFTTAKNPAAADFLNPQQTEGKKHPYMYTQCQAIHARSLFPCLDSPGMKFTYTAALTVPNPLVGLMSAIPLLDKTTTTKNTSTYFFKQPQAISSYLFAIVVGDLVSRDISDRCRIWSEPKNIEMCHFDFSNTEKLLAAGEEICGKYEWGRYDLVVLPPSFPFGGMENPNLSFMTPSLLTGDKSLANQVTAHELTHSWMGNLVTNRTWESFWLNEGWTMFVQRKIEEKCFSLPLAECGAAIGYFSLKNNVEAYGDKTALTRLVPTLTGVDPDEAFSTVPYEKGFNFLYFLESIVGKAKFSKFVKDYVLKFKNTPLDAFDFKDFFLSYKDFQPHLDEITKKVDWNAWFFGEGMPPVTNKFDESLIKKSENLAKVWTEGSTDKNEIGDWESTQVVLFLDSMIDRHENGVSLDKLKQMDNLYKFSSSKNCEILFRWYKLNLASKNDGILDAVDSFLGSIGRMKYVRPLFSFLKKYGYLERAKKIYAKNENFYHNVCSKMVKTDLS